MNRIVYNGQTGGLGRFLAPALERAGLPFTALRSRIEDSDGLVDELNALNATPADQITLVPLAGIVPVVVCEKEPERAFKTNVTDTTALVTRFLDWSKQRAIAARVLYVSSGHVYAPKNLGERLKETDRVLPRSVYARTKLQAENALREVFGASSKNLLIARVFGLLSPEQPRAYVLPALIQRAIKKDFSNMAGLDCVRDYLDARDVCRVLASLCALDWNNAALPTNRVANVCSGDGVAIRDLFALALEVAGSSLPAIEKAITTVPPRPDDIQWMVGDSTLATALIKTPTRSIHLKQTVRDAFEAAL
jgi:nucleoside-diphosphate-sugar epimerase